MLPVLSCVPQGSVIGPSLFLAHINGLPGSVKSRLRLFADDTIDYHTIKSHATAQILQENLDNLELLENTEQWNHLSSHTHFMTSLSEPHKTQNIPWSLSAVTLIGHLT